MMHFMLSLFVSSFALAVCGSAAHYSFTHNHNLLGCFNLGLCGVNIGLIALNISRLIGS